MIRKIFLGIVSFGLLALVFVVGTVSVLAQDPIPVNADPSHTLVYDNRPHYIPANTALWYAFHYAGDKSLILMKMFDATNSGLGFNLYTPEQVRRLRSEDKPFGRGTAINVNCGSDKCQSSDLTWKGATPIAGMYFIQVTNSAPRPQIFYLVVVGESVGIGAPLDGSSEQPANPPAPMPTPPNSPNSGDSPQNNQPQANPSNIYDHLQ